MLSIKASDLQWIAAKEGVQRAVLRDHRQGGRTYLVRMAKGSAAGMHRHHAPEEVYVLEGRIEMGGQSLGKGDFAFTDAGETHDVLATESTLLLVSTGKPLEFL